MLRVARKGGSREGVRRRIHYPIYCIFESVDLSEQDGNVNYSEYYPTASSISILYSQQAGISNSPCFLLAFLQGNNVMV